MSAKDNVQRLPRVLHFVTGGFSGATQVAVDLVAAHRQSGRFEAKLVLRRKRNTSAARVEALRARGLDVQVVAGWSHAASIWELWKVCREFQPDVLVAHGFSEHLWGRYAGLLAKVPRLVHVEHNSRERYTRWRLAQALWLSRRTQATVGCSEGVRQSLLQRGFPPETTLAISNGIRLAPYLQEPPLLAARAPVIVMAARFARQKDHATLLRALALLRERGLAPRLLLAGGGKASALKAARQLCAQLGLEQQVDFLGLCDNVPQLLQQSRICVLATHYEGMPLSLIEGMAAGCAVVASRVIGVQEVIDHGANGLLAEHADPASMADAFEQLLRGDALAQRLASAARQEALLQYSLERMTRDYEDLFASLLDTGAKA
ncbi:glycosyltransferase [Comamonas endophytica]|uniref:Glycosyltransferase n=1 Tax=Comamonas endophytica TaxID=2949090 RepID=A0ABY6GDY2_9BURK|nr:MULTISPECIES: glycosyltransferase [unclassified Acidovorax]MCD2512559.1 glycosyltransferase [Acidovorax sp. D4N7]UYG53078.1 glycosyltransferase [Acidovorax sp. 5MLIR]